MSDDCRNDCSEPLRFPRRPGTRLRTREASGTACLQAECQCGLCGQTVSEDNRPALPHINYRLGGYADIRAALLHRLNQSGPLSAWTYRGADDPGIALLEGAAILGDILTFYQELYANEAFLRTAQWRASVSELVRLLGYRLSPGIGGSATFAFEVKGDEALTIPAHFPIKAQLAKRDKPSDFETVAPLTAYPWLSKFHLYRPLTFPLISPGTAEFYLSWQEPGTLAVALREGDRLLLGDAADSPVTRLENPEVVIVDSVREWHGIKIYKIKGRLKRTTNATEVVAFKLGRAFHHLGSNGPRTITKLSSTTDTTPVTTIKEYNHSFARLVADVPTVSYGPIAWPDALGVSNTLLYCEPRLLPVEYPLDSEVTDLPTGALLLIELPLYPVGGGVPRWVTLLRALTGFRVGTQTFGLVTGTSTTITLDHDLGDGGDLITDVRQMLFQEVVGPSFKLRPAPQNSEAASGQDFVFFGNLPNPEQLDQRKLLLAEPGTEPIVCSVTDVRTSAELPQMRIVRLGQSRDYSLYSHESPSVVVYGNLVDATEGKSEPAEPLGNGDNRQIFQTFKLPKKPLTYHLAKDATPPETPELQIYVNDRLWQLAPTFFGRKPDEEIYIVREDEQGVSWVQFGDGKTGARLPSGVRNVVARYRTGSGSFGLQEPETKAQAGSRIKRLDNIQLPDLVTGGAEPEDAANARAVAPGKIQSLGRLVSLRDFETEAGAIPGVARVAASWRMIDHLPTVALTVLMETGRAGELNKVRDTIAVANRERGPQRYAVSVEQGKRHYVHLRVTFALDPRYRVEPVKAAIEKALGVNWGRPSRQEDPSGLFSLPQRSFGQPEYASHIEAVVQNVPGVVWARVTAFTLLSVTDDPAGILFTNLRDVLRPVPCNAGRVLSLYAPHLFLTNVAPQAEEVAWK